MARTNTHGDLFGRLVAVMVFVAGIAALVFVFMTAVHLFETPVPGLGLPVAKGAAPPTGLNIGIAMASLFAKLAILALLVLIASLIASKGVHLYLGAASAHHPNPVQTDAKDSSDSSETSKP